MYVHIYEYVNIYIWSNTYTYNVYMVMLIQRHRSWSAFL